MQAVYLGLAILLGGGLILFGVGAGNGTGGILNAFTGNGSSGAQGQAVSAQEKAALKATQQNPNSAAAWAELVSARWTSATGNNANYDSNTGQFTAAGKKELAALITAWASLSVADQVATGQHCDPRRPRLRQARPVLQRRRRLGDGGGRQPE